MPVSVQDFAAKIKQKYPQYQNIDDNTLTQKIIQKYPQYQSQVNFGNPQTPQPQPSQPKSTGFDWGGAVKGAIGSMTGQNNLAAQNMPSAGQVADYASESVAKPLVKLAAVPAGSAINTAKAGYNFVKAGGPFNPNAETQLKKDIAAPIEVPWIGNINPNKQDKATGGINSGRSALDLTGKVVDGGSAFYNAVNPVMGTFKQAFTRGALQSGAKALQEEDATPLSVGASTVAGGTLSGVLSPASLKFIGDKGNSFAKKLYSTAVKTPLKEAKYGVNIGDQLLNKGLKGSDKSLLSQVDGRRSVVINRRNDLLNNSNEKIDTQDIISKLNDYAKKQVVAPGKEEALQKSVDSMAASLKSRGKQLTPAEANKIKSALQKELKNLFGQESSAIQESNKFLARTLKGAIEKKVPGVKELNLDYQLYKRAAKSLKDNLARGDRNNLISLSDFGIGTGAGVLGGGPAGLLAVGAKKIMGSTMGKTNSAQYLNKLSKLVGKSKGDRSQILTQSIIKALLTDK